MHITQLVHRLRQQRPDDVLTVCAGRTRTVTESVDRIARLAGALTELGLTTGGRVAVLAHNSDRFHECLLAVPWAGGVVVPLNTRWSAEEIAFALADSETAVLFVDDAFAPLAPALRAKLPKLTAVVHCGDEITPDGLVSHEELVRAATPAPDVRRGGDDVFGIFYTGGTTGPAKGVMLSHRNVLTSALGAQAAGFLSGPGILLHTAPMFHLADLASWLSGLMAGSTHVMVPRFDVHGTLAAIDAHGVTDVLLVPTMIQMLVDATSRIAFRLSTLRRVVYGAAPMPAALLRRARKAFPHTEFVQAYGMTEAGPLITLSVPSDEPDHTTGRAAPHCELRVVDELGADVPYGQVGEVVVRGSNVMLGYWRREEETAAALRDGWLRTGDAATLDDRGNLTIVDRIKDMILSGGENVYPAEVERVLVEHPAVAAVAVVGVPDDLLGERVHAVVVARPGQTPSGAELREFCRRRIGGYKIPRSVEFVAELPTSGAGKVLKRTLRERHRALVAS
jgi:acyl-CoA synthetase (AMP-forming)/AMP-acid ligase II